MKTITRFGSFLVVASVTGFIVDSPKRPQNHSPPSAPRVEITSPTYGESTTHLVIRGSEGAPQEGSPVVCKLYDGDGRQVASGLCDRHGRGNWKIRFDVPPGVYTIHARIGHTEATDNRVVTVFAPPSR